MHPNVSARFRRALGVTICGPFLVAFVACGGSSSKGSSTTTVATGSPATPGGATGSTAAAGNPSATCSQVTKEQVQPLIADPITNVTVKPYGLHLTGQACTFATSDADGALVIYVVGGQEATDTYNSDVQGFGHAVGVPGVGDRAMRDGEHDTGEVTSTKGSTYCAVIPQNDLVPGVAKLMDAAGHTNNIGDTAFSEIASAVGTVCNRVYGSGNTTPDLSALTTAGAAAESSSTTEDALPIPSLPTDSTP